MLTNSGRPDMAAPGNRLLAAMSRTERGMLARETVPVELVAGALLLTPGERITHVVFPDSGLVSLIAVLPDGVRAEVGMVGREGLVGLPALLGEPLSMFSAITQVPGRGQRVEAGRLLTLADSSRNLRDLIRRYAMASLIHVSLNAACNAAHPLERRTARWLLGVQDRVGPGFPITQAHLAVMLGARRPTVNAVLQQLKSAGLVRHVRGRIAVADRAGLEALACSCYPASRAAMERLLPGALG